jgi:hypothetical protein
VGGVVGGVVTGGAVGLGVFGAGVAGAAGAGRGTCDGGSAITGAWVCGRAQIGPGSGNERTGAPARASSMNCLKMRAGTSPPNPAPGTRASALPCHTKAASCGVNPRKFASLCPSVVPVLPATGRPSASCAFVPVPPVTTPRRMSVSHAVTSEESTR